jgi:hypothetical protein
MIQLYRLYTTVNPFYHFNVFTPDQVAYCVINTSGLVCLLFPQLNLEEWFAIATVLGTDAKTQNDVNNFLIPAVTFLLHM